MTYGLRPKTRFCNLRRHSARCAWCVQTHRTHISLLLMKAKQRPFILEEKGEGQAWRRRGVCGIWQRRRSPPHAIQTARVEQLVTDTANEYRSREAFHHTDRVSHPRSLMGYLMERSPFFRAERIREKKKLGAHPSTRPEIKQPQSHSKSKSKSHRVVSHHMIRYPRPRP